MAEIMMPQKKQESSMGRRLFGAAATIVGGIYGGPAGAAAGQALSAKLNGASNEDAVMGGIKSYAGDKMSSAMSRKVSANSQDPKVGINEGLNALESLPQPMREQYTPALVKAQMLSQGGNKRYMTGGF